MKEFQDDFFFDPLGVERKRERDRGGILTLDTVAGKIPRSLARDKARVTYPLTQSTSTLGILEALSFFHSRQVSTSFLPSTCTYKSQYSPFYF